MLLFQKISFLKSNSIDEILFLNDFETPENFFRCKNYISDKNKNNINKIL